MYHVSDKVKHNGCGAPWNLEDVEELHMILQDKILDTKCQLGFDEAKAHKDNFYGDINLVSGIPFPLMKLEPKYYRMRLLNAAVSRTYKLKVKNAQMQDVSQNICHVIAGDGGYRFTPVTFPANVGSYTIVWFGNFFFLLSCSLLTSYLHNLFFIYNAGPADWCCRAL